MESEGPNAEPIRTRADVALVLVGHGSTVNKDSAAPVYLHARELRRRACFGRVCEAFWKQEPHLADVLQQCREPRVFVVPFFISEGYFTEQAIPAALGFRDAYTASFSRVIEHSHQTWYYCQPVGTHPSMTAVILARARQVVARYPFPREAHPSLTALFVAGHGTERHGGSRQAIEDQVGRIRATSLYGEVHAIYLEENPLISACYTLTRLPNIVVVPFFISNGLHVNEDIPVLLGESPERVQARVRAGLPGWRNPTEKQGKRVWLAPSVGDEPTLSDVILQRVEEAETSAPPEVTQARAVP